jgi:hypothetical protein
MVAPTRSPIIVLGDGIKASSTIVQYANEHGINGGHAVWPGLEDDLRVASPLAGRRPRGPGFAVSSDPGTPHCGVDVALIDTPARTSSMGRPHAHLAGARPSAPDRHVYIGAGSLIIRHALPSSSLRS